jgi:hypothetical protein
MVSSIVTLAMSVWLAHSPAQTVTDKILAGTDQANPVLVAQQYRDEDPHGDDPHGRDAHDEVHDSDLPAHSMARGKATDNVYGNSVDVRNSQHPLDNYPGQPGF